MKLTDITSTQLFIMNPNGKTKEEIISELVDLVQEHGYLHNRAEYEKAVLAREEESSTGIGMGIAIPHGKSTAVKEPVVAFARVNEGVDWQSLDDEPANLIFMIGVPEEAKGDAHLKILQMLSRNLVSDEFREELLQANDEEAIYGLLERI